MTGLPVGSILTDHASIPEIPKVTGDEPPMTVAGVDAARLIALSKQHVAKGDEETNYIPQLSFFAQYNRNTTLLNNVNQYFSQPLPANNFFSGFNINIPLFDMGHRAKGRESDADALRATVEAEQAQRQNDVQIAQLNGSLRELDAQAEVAGLKQQIAADELKTVQTELESGNGAAGQPGGTGAGFAPRPASWRGSTSGKSTRMRWRRARTGQGAARPAARAGPHAGLDQRSNTRNKPFSGQAQRPKMRSMVR